MDYEMKALNARQINRVWVGNDGGRAVHRKGVCLTWVLWEKREPQQRTGVGKAHLPFAFDIHIDVSDLAVHRPASTPASLQVCVMCRHLVATLSAWQKTHMIPADWEEIAAALSVCLCHFWESLQKRSRCRHAQPV